MTRTSALLAAVALLAACSPEPTVVRDATPGARASQATLGSAVNRDLATLRQATASFHDFATAKDAGWSTPITDCMTDPVLGGMGVHFGNVGLIDGAVQVDQPEVLLYEPERNGRLRLVAVEYVVPYAFRARDAEPPVLFGRQFKQNDAFQLWGLHAWVWDENPSGIFADWNPRVTCDFAPSASVMTMSHH